MLQFDRITLRRGPRVLFRDASFTVFRGEKVGLTGENGSGKSSLLSLVRGELAPDAGQFGMPQRLAVAHVAQELEPSPRPAIEFVLDGDTALRDIEARIAAAEAAAARGGDDNGALLADLHGRYAAAGGYDAKSRAAQLMAGLGFAPGDTERPVADFSGGWRVRLNVARALMCPSDLLLLDEPTNHLDLDAILWLEGWLRAYPGTLLLIAHDREFLDRVVDRIVNIEQGKVTAYRGNYSDFETQRSAQLAQAASSLARQQREIAHIESFVERFRAQATKARQAQSRIKALERMQRIAPAHVDSPFRFEFPAPDRLPRPLLALEDSAAGYAGKAPLLTGLSLTVYPGDRISLLGRNGAGKSTYMKLLAGSLAPQGGLRTDARDLRIGYFAQHQLEQLDPAASAVVNLQRTAEACGRTLLEQEQRDFLAGFGFTGERVFDAVGPFSGGEKARLVLAMLALQRPNLMLLDEPTNHLDLEMREALVLALQDYTGAVILVSHDRHLLRTVSDRFLLVAGGRATPFDGDLEDYAAWLKADAAAAASSPGDAGGERGAESAEARRQRRRDEADRRARLAPLRNAIKRCETELASRSAEAEALDLQLADPAVHAPGAKDTLRTLLARRTVLTRDIAALEEDWLARSEELERLETAP